MDDEAGRTSPIETNTAYKELVDRLNRDWLFGGAALRTHLPVRVLKPRRPVDR